MTDFIQIPDASERSAPARRRAHRKSRMGCITCKKSRIKCDEVRPVCKNCHRRDAVCHYLDTSRTRDCPAKNVEIVPKQSEMTVEPEPVATMSMANEIRSVSQLSGILAQRSSLPQGCLLELQLCHHFLEMTKKSTHIQATWSYWVLEQATQSAGVMDALLGTSAFHLQRFSKFDTKLLMVAHGYMARAIEGHKKDLSGGLDELNTSKVVATCALILTHANSNAYPLSGDSDQRQPHDWFISFRRAIDLLNKASPLIQDTVVGQELRNLRPIIRQDIHPNPFSFLLYYNPPSESFNQEEIGVCTTAVAHLSYIYVGLITEKPLRFPICVSDSFVALVTEKVPRALAICGYFFMVVKLGRQFWWIDGAPEREFDIVMRYLPRNWWSVMDWASRIFEWNDRSTAL